MLASLITLVVYLIICGVLWWAVNAIVAILSPWLASPFPQLIQVCLILILAFILISAILQIAGFSGVNHLPMYR